MTMEKHNWSWQIDAAVLPGADAGLYGPWLEMHWRVFHCARELQQLQERLRRRTRELEDANEQLRQQKIEMERLATTDPLTGLLNRRAIEAAARDEILRRERHPGPFALGLVDADHFKDINSRYLHPGGDQALIGLAGALTSAIRATDRVGRLGGEEFLVVAPHTDRAGAATLAERIRMTVEQASVRYHGQTISMTASVGFAVVEADRRPAYEELTHVAAVALAAVKANGRNSCVVRSL
jgi:diguanylate cyclase (GGDEF)-like protein